MWLTAVILGVAGSLHCLGMCSPLVMAVTSLRPSAILNRVVYNSGRIMVYAIMGSLVASAGLVLPLHKFQNLISMVLGAALVIIGCLGIRTIKIPGLTAAMQRLSSLLKNVFGSFMKRKSLSTVFILGSLNGLLPCGLTVIALTWCVTLRGPLDGFNFMLLFGAGTLPVMLGFTGIFSVFAKRLNWNFNTVITSMLILSGCLLIARVFLTHLSHTTLEEARVVEIILCR
jgi:uncharacterized protein